MKFLLFISFLLLPVLPGLAHAAPLPPSAKPMVLYSSAILSPEDAEIYLSAFEHARSQDWQSVKRLQAQATDPALADLILWRYVNGAGKNADLEYMSLALQRLADWPYYRRLKINAEAVLAEAPRSHSQIIDWFETYEAPISGKGKIIYAVALDGAGQTDDALRLIKEVWAEHYLSRADEKTILTKFGSKLSQAEHEMRVEFLLWGRQLGQVDRIVSLVSPDYRKLIAARKALIRYSSGVDALIRAVPDRLQSNPGLLYERAKWRRQRARNQAGATELLLNIDGKDVPQSGRDNLWKERRLAVRTALKEKKYDIAYRLAASHGLSSGLDFAEAEWMAGWIALRFIDKPEIALTRFTHLSENVGRAISLSRGHYWRGRALSALGQTEEAAAAFQMAAQYNYTYYGQLAAEETDYTDIDFTAPAAPSEAERAAFEARPLVKALRLLGEAGHIDYFRIFSLSLDDQLKTSSEQLLQAEILRFHNRPELAVRVGKVALGVGSISPDVAYPVIRYPLQVEADIEEAFTMALSRQESEFNPRAQSHANARGLMQLIPSTARLQAKRENLPYQAAWLIEDPSYNMTLGSTHLADLVEEFNGSYIMAAAAYNAGASRPSRWVLEYGDPRKGEIDPIDWVELVPFSETRNYIQRVLENVQVYRHRLAGEATQISLSQDLRRGQFE